MKQLPFIILFIIVSTTSSRGNDGSFNSMGNTLIPLQETVIQLKKEKLNITRIGEWIQVDVYFEFYNPADKKQITVGFVTPPAFNEFLNSEERQHPQVKDFTVKVNDSLLTFKVHRLQTTGFKITDSFVHGTDFVYYFNVNFSKGKTTIKHSYLYRGGGTNFIAHSFYYRLTTGKLWANREIGDFELNIDMGDDVYFYLPYSFNRTKVDWKIIGRGTLSKTPMLEWMMFDNGDTLRTAYIRDGYVQFKKSHFKPIYDLHFGIYNSYWEPYMWCEMGKENDFIILREFFHKEYAEENVRKLTDVQLNLLINLPYARAGYDFKDPKLKKIFSKCIWYLPEPSVSQQFKKYFFDLDVAAIFNTEEKRRKNAKHK